jgi:hypothetical protein
MTYSIKKLSGKYYLHNKTTKSNLRTAYSDRAKASRAITSMNKRVQGTRSYHKCCHDNKCGKKHKAKTTPMASTVMPTRAQKPKKKKRATLTPVAKTKKKRKQKKRRTSKGLQTYENALMALEGKAQRLDAQYNRIVF